MAALTAGRTASDMPGLDIAEQRSWQNLVAAITADGRAAAERAMVTYEAAGGWT